MAVAFDRQGVTVGKERQCAADGLSPGIALRWFALALLIRLLVGTVVDLYSLLRGFDGFYPLASGHDDRTYWYYATQLVQGQTVLWTPSSYPYALAAIFFLTGPSLVVGKLLNVLVGSLTVYIGVRLAQRLATERAPASARAGIVAGHWAGAFLTFYPSLLFYSTQLVKDPLLVLAGVSALSLVLRFLRRPQSLIAMLGVVAFGGMFLLRPYAALALAIGLFGFTLWLRRHWIAPAVVLAAVAPVALGWGVFGSAYLTRMLNPAFLTSFREGTYSIGGSATGIRLDFSNPLALLTSYSYSFATAMFGPFPWQLVSAAQFIALPEALVLWALFPIWAMGLWRLARGRLGDEALLLIFSLVLIGAVALFSDNIGANTRLRMLSWLAFFLFASLYLPEIRLPGRHGERQWRDDVPLATREDRDGYDHA